MPLDLDQLRDNLSRAQSPQYRRAIKSRAVDELEAIGARQQALEANKQGPFDTGLMANDADGFFQRQRDKIEQLKLRQFLAGKEPNATPRSVQGLENYGTDPNAPLGPRTIEEADELARFRGRVAPQRPVPPGRTF